METLQALVEATPLNIELAQQVIWWMVPPRHPSACLYRDKALLDADGFDEDIIQWLLEAREWLWCTQRIKLRVEVDCSRHCRLSRLCCQLSDNEIDAMYCQLHAAGFAPNHVVMYIPMY